MYYDFYQKMSGQSTVHVKSQCDNSPHLYDPVIKFEYPTTDDPVTAIFVKFSLRVEIWREENLNLSISERFLDVFGIFR